MSDSTNIKFPMPKKISDELKLWAEAIAAADSTVVLKNAGTVEAVLFDPTKIYIKKKASP